MRHEVIDLALLDPEPTVVSVCFQPGQLLFRGRRGWIFL